MGLRFQCIYITFKGIPLLNETTAISIARTNIIDSDSEGCNNTLKCKRKKQNIKNLDAEKLSLEQWTKNVELKLTCYEKKYATTRYIAAK
jgi:hypothetical protein